MTTNGSVELSPVDMEFLHIFKYGIPCRSHILPKTIKDIPIIRDRKSELMVGYCKVTNIASVLCFVSNIRYLLLLL